MTRWAALLRGINVGGKNRIPMPALTSALTAIGLEDVVTYVQSGNVVFSSAKAHDALKAAVERAIADTFALDIAVLLRTQAELARIVAANPLVERQADRKLLHVVFLEGEPAAEAGAKLDPNRSPGDEFVVAGCEVYVHYPNGSGRSKLTLDYFERVLGVRATARNWNTVTKLLAVTQR